MNESTSAKEPTMDTELRRYQIETHLGALRAEAANNRLARGRQDRMAAPISTTKAPNRIDAIMRALGSMTTVRLVDPEQPHHGSRP
jgi:hypothetical protein